MRTIRSLTAMLVLASALCLPAPRLARADATGSYSHFDPPHGGRNWILDSANRRVLAYGGSRSGANPFTSEIWEFTLSRPHQWRLVPTAGTPPPPRVSAGVVFDTARRRMIVVGGLNLTQAFNDVWALDLNTPVPTWSQILPQGTPPAARGQHGLAYDPVRDRIVLLAGETFFPAFVEYSDLWQLSLTGTPTWTRMQPTGPGPGGVDTQAFEYDPDHDQFLCWGGWPYNAGFRVLSTAGDGVWTLLPETSPAPAPRQADRWAWDSLRHRFAFYGGLFGNNTSPLDAWTVTATDSARWTPLAWAGPTPTSRFRSACVYDDSTDALIVSQGYYAGSIPIWYSDTWELPLATSPAHWALSTPSVPTARQSAGATLDSRRNRLIVFGGRNTAGRVRDTWALPFADPWTARRLDTGTPPPGMEWPTCAYDPRRDAFVVYGGYDGSEVDSIWVLPLNTADGWQRPAVAGTRPSARFATQSVVDPVRDRLVVFGGSDHFSQSFGDVSTLSLADFTWSAVTTQGAPPPARFGGLAVYDPRRDRMIVFGGQIGSTYLNDVWALSLADFTWTPIVPSGTAPAGRIRPWGAYDPVRDRLMIGSGQSSSAYADTWALQLSPSPAWIALTPAGLTPGARTEAASGYDPVRDRIVIHSGVQAAQQTFTLDFDEPLAPAVEVPGDLTWSAGAPLAARYVLHNPYPFAQTAYWELSGERTWPGLSQHGERLVAAASAETLDVSIPVPDSAATGMQVLALSATWLGSAQTTLGTLHAHDGTTATAVALVATDAAPDHVTLTWQGDFSRGEEASVERRAIDGAWSEVGRVAADGAGRATWRDVAVRSGETWQYRLRYSRGGATAYTGETTILVPEAYRLALAASATDRSRLVLDLTLPADGVATLDVFDPAGRRLTSNTAMRVAGPQSWVMEEPATRRPGLYFVRLRQGRASVVAKALVIR